MNLLLFLFLAVISVKCDPGSFKVYWNVPTSACAANNISFLGLYEKYGILQNTGDKFEGDVITIMYNPGRFPSLNYNKTNGVVPQRSDLKKHLDAFEDTVEESVADEEFNGIAVISFDGWRPTFRQNFNKLQCIKNISYNIETTDDTSLTTSEAEALAKTNFENAARDFMESTLLAAQELRPKASWGYYGYPYCYNTVEASCATNVPQENDLLSWLWSNSSSLFPTVYSSSGLTSSELEALIAGRVNEAKRVKPGAIVLPYIKFKYEDGGYFSQDDVNTALSALHGSDASGAVVWGSSSDVTTAAKCAALQEYLDQTLGPAIAEYTLSSQTDDTTTDSSITETTTA